jgi:hypothetical protein
VGLADDGARRGLEAVATHGGPVQRRHGGPHDSDKRRSRSATAP